MGDTEDIDDGQDLGDKIVLLLDSDTLPAWIKCEEQPQIHGQKFRILITLDDPADLVVTFYHERYQQRYRWILELTLGEDTSPVILTFERDVRLPCPIDLLQHHHPEEKRFIFLVSFRNGH
jgi:hypothetical protein